MNAARTACEQALEQIVVRIKTAPLSISDRDLLMEIRSMAQAALHPTAPPPHRADVPTTTVVPKRNGGFAVLCNGELMDIFATRRDAEHFATQHDTLAGQHMAG